MFVSSPLLGAWQVKYAHQSGGPLGEDSSPIALPIEPVGFNRTQELISAMTYSKAPEFVRMVRCRGTFVCAGVAVAHLSRMSLFVLIV